MTVKDVVKAVCQKRECTLAELAESMEQNPSTFRATLNRNEGMGMTVAKFLDWMARMDMEVLVNDLNDDEEYVLDDD